MNTQPFNLRLQAYLDAELPANEVAAFEQELARDPAAQALLNELRGTRAALAGFDASVKVPESRAFYWSQISRRIEVAERREAVRQPPTGWFRSFRRLLLPMGTAAAVLLIGVFASLQPGFFQRSSVPVDMDATVSDPGALTYRDFSTRTTLVWLTYPAEK